MQDNIWFDSKKEQQRYAQLKLLLKAGEIRDLAIQVSYTLQEGFTNRKTKYRPIIYIADFTYIDVKTAIKIVEDVKGKRTKEYQIKKKLFIHRFPSIEFREI